jgi:uncharacterized protein (TIGR02231 family)
MPDVRHWAAFICCAVSMCATAAPAQNAPATVDATPMAVNAKITAVTLYRGRASVTRSAEVSLEPGAYDLQFADLPLTVQPSTLQARAAGAVKVIGVDFSQQASATASSAQIAALDARIEQLQAALKEIAEQRDLVKAQEDFVDSVSLKATGSASEVAGTDKLDLDAIRKLMEFVADERAKLLTARRELDARQRDVDKQLQIVQSERNALGGGGNTSRTAIVSVVATDASKAVIELSYLVSNATWEPSYNIRAQIDGSSAQVEYDAILMQQSGEDWENVKLLLSTAQPTLAANPPTIQPWFVDIWRPEDADRSAAGLASLAGERRAAGDEEFAPQEASADKAKNLEQMIADASVGGAGPSVTFELPRTVTVKTNVQRQQRTRIATVDTHPKFMHVAVPMLTEAVYIRGELTNASAYQLLPGRASIFVGHDYVGPTTLDSVPPGGEFKIHFGVDPAVRAARQLVHKLTENTGLLSGGRRTTYSYRISLDNGTGKPITVELWDRYPVSRHEDIQIELVDLSAPLSADAYYVSEERPQGLLKWIIDVPAGSSGRSAHVVSYGVHVDRAKGVELTPLPE